MNLTPGTLYQLQVFMLDDRSGISKTFPLQFQQVKWAGNSDNIDNSSPATEIGYMQGITIGGNGVTQANGEIATVYFTIDAGYNGLLVNTWDNGAFNGMQLRTVGLPADYDGNGSVGPEDYAVWRANLRHDEQQRRRKPGWRRGCRRLRRVAKCHECGKRRERRRIEFSPLSPNRAPFCSAVQHSHSWEVPSLAGVASG